MDAAQVPQPTSKKKVAIIIIPGIGGSNVINSSPGIRAIDQGFGENLTAVMGWYHLKKPMKDVRDMLVKTSIYWKPWVASIKTYDPDGKKGWSQVASSFYHPFMIDCGKTNQLKFEREIFAIGYNFTQSNYSSADTVLKRTEEIMQNSDFVGYVYITHSMGSFPARVALKKMETDDRNLYRKCLGVIHIAAPNLGAAEAYKRFITGVATSDITAYILGNSGEKFSLIGCVMPSMCELLPVGEEESKKVFVCPAKADVDPLKLLPDLVKNDILKNYDNRSKEETVVFLEQNIERAIQFHKFLGSFMHPKTKALVLSQVNTVMRIKLEKETSGSRSFTYDYTSSGDGTVVTPSQAAHVHPDNVLTLTGIAHADPLSEKGRQQVFPALYKLIQNLIDTSSFASILSSLGETAFNFALSSEPILLNGMKVIFDQSVGVYPVTLEPKKEAQSSGNRN